MTECLVALSRVKDFMMLRNRRFPDGPLVRLLDIDQSFCCKIIFVNRSRFYCSVAFGDLLSSLISPVEKVIFVIAT